MIAIVRLNKKIKNIEIGKIMNNILNEFINWMNEHRTSSQSTIEKYARTVNTV